MARGDIVHSLWNMNKHSSHHLIGVSWDLFTKRFWDRECVGDVKQEIKGQKRNFVYGSYEKEGHSFDFSIKRTMKRMEKIGEFHRSDAIKLYGRERK